MRFVDNSLSDARREFRKALYFSFLKIKLLHYRCTCRRYCSIYYIIILILRDYVVVFSTIKNIALRGQIPCGSLVLLLPSSLLPIMPIILFIIEGSFSICCIILINPFSPPNMLRICGVTLTSFVTSAAA